MCKIYLNLSRVLMWVDSQPATWIFLVGSGKSSRGFSSWSQRHCRTSPQSILGPRRRISSWDTEVSMARGRAICSMPSSLWSQITLAVWDRSQCKGLGTLFFRNAMMKWAYDENGTQCVDETWMNELQETYFRISLLCREHWFSIAQGTTLFGKGFPTGWRVSSSCFRRRAGPSYMKGQDLQCLNSEGWQESHECRDFSISALEAETDILTCWKSFYSCLPAQVLTAFVEIVSPAWASGLSGLGVLPGFRCVAVAVVAAVAPWESSRYPSCFVLAP